MALRVGILTMHRVRNCGSQLQAYALQRVVEKLGHSCDIIDYRYPDVFHYHQKMSKGDLRSFNGVVKLIFSCLGVLPIVQWLNMWRVGRKHEIEMKRGFVGVHLTRRYTRKSIQRRPPKYDIYLTGSDQVWNPNCIVGDYNFLLSFAPSGARRVAYSSSFGLKKLPESCKADYAKLLQSFGAIGVREPSGVEIVHELTGKRAKAVLDPTMLLSETDWRGYAGNVPSRKRPFVFMYVLSYVFNSSPWIMGYARKVAELLNCEVVFYGGGECTCEQDAYDAGFEVLPNYIAPQELVRYYLDADYIIATGFHGTAFAITLNKQFSIVLNPNPSDDDRVLSLLKRLGCEGRGIVCGADYADLDLEWLRAEPVGMKGRFVEQRDESAEFLKRALDVS